MLRPLVEVLMHPTRLFLQAPLQAVLVYGVLKVVITEWRSYIFRHACNSRLVNAHLLRVTILTTNPSFYNVWLLQSSVQILHSSFVAIHVLRPPIWYAVIPDHGLALGVFGPRVENHLRRSRACSHW